MLGKDGFPGDELLSNNTRRVEVIEHQYRVFAVQAYKLAYRGSIESDRDGNASYTINATSVGFTRFRVVQSDISTHILQVLLAALFPYATITYAILWRGTGGTRRILPHNPFSIASMMTSLAGSGCWHQKS